MSLLGHLTHGVLVSPMNTQSVQSKIQKPPRDKASAHCISRGNNNWQRTNTDTTSHVPCCGPTSGNYSAPAADDASPFVRTQRWWDFVARLPKDAARVKHSMQPSITSARNGGDVPIAVDCHIPL
eukprot:5797797-Amphidinium_carterae.1